jgi:replication fork clamp-binding protein CrfC
MKVSALNLRLKVVLVCLLSAPGLAAEDSSLSDPNLEIAEAKVTSETLFSQNDLLRKQLSLDRETQKTLTDSLVVSNAEAELFRRKFSELQLRMDALGIESVSKDRAKLEQRLLAAVSDLQLLNKEKEAYREQLLQLTETMLRYVKSTQNADPHARAEVEAQLRSTNQLLMAQDAPSEEGRPDLMDGKVLSVKEEWSLVVGNLGAQQGVKIGMPLRVVRGGKTVATLRVVDVREKISGAVIQELDSEKVKIKVGDRLQVDARQEISLK